MAKKRKEPEKSVEVFFTKSFGRDFEWDVMEEDLAEIAGLREGSDSMGEFGSGCSAFGTFPVSKADTIAEKFRGAIGKKVAGYVIKSVEVKDS